MKVNRRKVESIIVLTFIISSIIITPILISLDSSNIYYLNDNQNHDNLEDNLKRDPPPPSPSSNSPSNAHYFNFYKNITIDSEKVSGSNDLVDFPLLISILDSHLQVQVQSNGNDIAFSNGTDWLDHEIELFEQDYNPSYAKLVAWVRIPLLSGSEDTVIYMYYGNSTMDSQQMPTDVWDSNCVGVWHLKEDPTDPIHDSTIKNYEGTSYGGMAPIDQVDGKIDGSLDFDGSDDRIVIGEIDSDSWTAITLEAWMKMDNTGDDRVISKEEGTGYGPHIWMLGKSGNNLKCRITTDGTGGAYSQIQSSGGLTIGNWHYIAMTWDSSSERFIGYIDGEPVANIFRDGDSITNSMVDVILADQAAGVRQFDGIMSEARIYKDARSEDWIRTEYNNQFNPNDFYNVSRAYKARVPSTEDFDYFKEITIDAEEVAGNNDLIDFPLLISILDSDLKTHARSDGADILFSNGTEWLEHEIERYNPNYDRNNAQLIAWIRIPILSATTDTDIYMYYGNSTMNSLENPSGVWDSTYKGVWHLFDSSGTDVAKDSTSHSGFGDTRGTITKSSNGKIDGAYDFGTDGTIIVEDHVDEHLDFSETQSFTISFWINLSTSTDTWQLPLYKGGDIPQNEGYNFETSENGQYLTFYICDNAYNRIGSYSAVVFPFNTWYYITGVVNRTSNSIHMYKNGAEVGSGKNISTIGSLSNINDLQFPWADFELNGLLDEVRISDVSRSPNWITTEYNNQYNPNSFYSVGPEQTGFANVQVNAIDSYGNPIPNVNVTIFNSTEIKGSVITNNDGYALFTNIPQSAIDGYNFTVNVISNIEPFDTVTINRTSEAFKIEDPFHNITLICNASRNIFSINDVDGIPLDSGWIIVSKGLKNLQNCTIGATGYATFLWLDTTGYSYKVWYQDVVYDPNPVLLKSDVILAPNIPILLTVNLTTVNFTIWTGSPSQAVSGAKLMFYNSSSGKSIVNFTTDMNGKATFRWLTTNYEFNYSLNVTFYGENKQIKIYGTIGFKDKLELEIIAATSFDIDMDMAGTQIEDFETKIVLLMSDIYKPWGTKITLRALFNVTKTGGLKPIGPTYADSMLYQIFEGSTLILSGTIPIESDYIGRHQCTFETTVLEAKWYTIIIRASKEEYVAPDYEEITLYLFGNEILLNQSENDDSEKTVYWAENINMSATPYGEITEDFIVEQSIFQSVDPDFKFSIPDISSSWNLSEITFNIYNITWTGAENDINITIKDPYGDLTKYTRGNHSGWDIDGHKWIGLTYMLEKGSPFGDNSFNFTIGGSFDGAVDIITDINFIRDKINIEYSLFNATDIISLLSDGNGWVINNITFYLYNCCDPSDWSVIDPDSAIEKLVTNEGINYNFISHEPGTGKIIIDNITIYPLDGQFLFDIINISDIMFDVNISVEFIQGFYRNEYLETINSSETFHNIDKNFEIQISVVEYNWMDNNAILLINEIWNGTDYFLPSDVEMNITINGITYTDIIDIKGNGEFSLNGFNKDQIYTAVIGTNQSVNFKISCKIFYSRMVFYKIHGTITYAILGTDIFNQPVQYYENSGCYIQLINTTHLDADEYNSYTIRFTCNKDNYISDSIDLDLRVLERLTMIGYGNTNKIIKLRIFSNIYVEDSSIFTFSFIDSEYGTNIQDLNSQVYEWEYYNTENQFVNSGSGDLISNADNEYILDINTDSLPVGTYYISITLEKQNYRSKAADINLIINKREIDYDLGDMFEEKQTSVVKGKSITLEIELTDPTKGDIPLRGAKVILEIGDDELEFEEVEDGVYELEFETDDYEAFFTSNTITGTIKISKANYTTNDVDITIIIEIEEIEVIPGVPGIPIFYLLLLITTIGSVVGSLATYKYIQIAKIPKFVKKARAMKKAIKTGNNITESLLTTSKEESILKQFENEWEEVGISLEEVLRIKPKKDEVISNGEGGAK